MDRRPFICGNWKMNTFAREAQALVADVARLCSQAREVDVAIAPPFVHLGAAARKLEDSRVKLAAQNIHTEEKGAYTGETSASMLRDIGCAYVIVGHSERRQYFGEDDATVAGKTRAALAAGLGPIVCVGERLEDREAGRTMEVVERQLRGALGGLSGEELGQVTVAYEPVWAIGTGKTATPAQAQEVHASIRSLLVLLGGREVAEAIRIQYGGSMKPGNAAELLANPDVDGGLIGGAALQADSFASIVKAARESV